MVAIELLGSGHSNLAALLGAHAPEASRIEKREKCWVTWRSRFKGYFGLDGLRSRFLVADRIEPIVW